MDQSLKARLIGATVLVALAVLLIPELLSGRRDVEPVVDDGAADRGTRSFTIELGGAGGQGAVVPSASAPAAPPKRDPASPEARPPDSPSLSSASGGESDPPLPAPPRQSTDAARSVAAAAPPTVIPEQPAAQLANQMASPAASSTGEWLVQGGRIRISRVGTPAGRGACR
jgi:DedD protein